jgi:hypothetical protein
MVACVLMKRFVALDILSLSNFELAYSSFPMQVMMSADHCLVPGIAEVKRR